MSTKAPIIKRRGELLEECYLRNDKLGVALYVHERREAESRLYRELRENWEGKSRSLKGQLTRLENRIKSRQSEARAIGKEIKKLNAELDDIKQKVAVWQKFKLEPNTESFFEPLRIPKLSRPIVITETHENSALRFAGIYTVWENETTKNPCLYVGKSVNINNRVPHEKAKPGEVIRAVAIPADEHLFYECLYIAALRPLRNKARPS